MQSTANWVSNFLKRIGADENSQDVLTLCTLNDSKKLARLVYKPLKQLVCLEIMLDNNFTEIWCEDINQPFYQQAHMQDLKRLLREEMDAFLGDPDLN